MSKKEKNTKECPRCRREFSEVKKFKEHLEDMHNYGKRIDGTWGPPVWHYRPSGKKVSLMERDLKEDEVVTQISGPTYQLTKRKVKDDNKKKNEEKNQKETV